MKNKSAIYTPILLIVVYLLLIAVRYVPSDVLGIDENPYLAVVILQLLIYAVPSLFYCRVKGRDFTSRLRLRLPRPGHILVIIYASVFLACGSALISMGMYRLMPGAFSASSASEYASFAMNRGIFDGMYMVIAFAILPAVTEEFLFRGIIVGEYEKYGIFFAVMLSSLSFAMSHFNFARLPVYLFCGVVLSMILYATRSILSCIIVHTVNNASVLFLEKYLLNIAQKRNISMILFVILLATLALISLILLFSETGGIYRGYAKEDLPVDYGRTVGTGIFSRIAETYFSPTFLILVVIFITMSLS